MIFQFLAALFLTAAFAESDARLEHRAPIYSIQPVPFNAAYPEQCFLEKYNMALNPTVEYQVPDMCAKMRCDDSKTFVYFSMCNNEEEYPGCKIVEGNKTTPFPICCPFLKCGDF